MYDGLCARDGVVGGGEELKTNFITIDPIAAIKPSITNSEVLTGGESVAGVDTEIFSRRINIRQNSIPAASVGTGVVVSERVDVLA